jgi:hypothetical protein
MFSSQQLIHSKDIGFANIPFRKYNSEHYIKMYNYVEKIEQKFIIDLINLQNNFKTSFEHFKLYYPNYYNHSINDSYYKFIKSIFIKIYKLIEDFPIKKCLNVSSIIVSTYLIISKSSMIHKRDKQSLFNLINKKIQDVKLNLKN